MKKTIVLCAYNVANFPEGGGHFWVYMQYALGLRSLGCDVYWLENFRRRRGREACDEASISTFFGRLEAMGFGGKVILIAGEETTGQPARSEILGMTNAEADAVFERADLLLNFHYAIAPELLARFRRSALVDIDPGLFQLWMSDGQLAVPRHDHCFTTGETVGQPDSPIPTCGLPWVHIHPPVSLEHWDRVPANGAKAMTTVSSWLSSDWVREGEGFYENTKRVAFLPFQQLPRLTHQPLELALFLRTEDDERERQILIGNGWRIRDSRAVAGTPQDYRSYIRGSRGEFSCAKPSCMKLQNAWISDRTLCYLASGRPAVVQNTGPSRFLPNGEGLFRFHTLEEAAAALEALNADYERHCHAARALAEAYFDARRVAAKIVEVAAS